MVNIDVAVGALAVAVTMILWGIDKIWPKPPRWFGVLLGVVFLFVGFFWFYIAYVAATA